MNAVLKKLRDYTRRTNKKFEKASREEKRVIIAQDVIRQIEIGRILPYSEYLDTKTLYDRLRHGAGNIQIRDLLKDEAVCRACAIGSVFLAAVERCDALTINDVTRDLGRTEMVRYLRRLKLFSAQELRYMETVFEDYTAYVGHRQRDFLITMMQMIIDGKGQTLTLRRLCRAFPGVLNLWLI